MRFLIPLLTLLVLLLSPALCPSADQPGVATFGGAPTVVTTADAPAIKPLAQVKLKRGINFRQRRKMGITFRNIRRVLAELNEAGELEGTDTTTVSVMVLDRLVTENPTAFSPSIDWDNVLALIEKIIELLMKFLPFFL